MDGNARIGRGFSCPELLVVAALLLLLGAIATVNYRRSQAQAEYAQILGNFQQLKNALDAYGVDNGGAYPETDTGTAAYSLGYRTFDRLTTPIAYIPAIPVSPYTEAFASGSPGNPYVGTERNAMRYVRKLNAAGAVDPNYQADVQLFAFMGNTLGGLEPFLGQSQWLLRSVGPDGLDDRADLALLARPYDPSNGTLSRGDVAWFSNLQVSPWPASGVSEWWEYR